MRSTKQVHYAVSLTNLLRIRENNYINSRGVEYDKDSVDNMIIQKQSNKSIRKTNRQMKEYQEFQDEQEFNNRFGHLDTPGQAKPVNNLYLTKWECAVIFEALEDKLTFYYDEYGKISEGECPQDDKERIEIIDKIIKLGNTARTRSRN